MQPEHLLDELRRRGFRLASEAGRLAVQPASQLTPELRAAITAHRAELLDLLGQPPVPAAAPGVPVTPLRHEYRLPCACPAAVCWRCCNRPCEVCGKPTGSALIRTCYLCGLQFSNER
jgi:hypothetical protein